MNGNTLTIELPEHLASRMAAMLPDERNRFAVAALDRALTESEVPPTTNDEAAAAAVSWWAGLTEAEREAERDADARARASDPRTDVTIEAALSRIRARAGAGR